MTTINSVPFTKEWFIQFKSFNHWYNWPVVYIIEDWDEAYIWETTNIYSRSNQHFSNENRRKLRNIHIISDDEYNKSATLDTESLLIQYMFADGSRKLQNWNGWLSNHNYFDRELYIAKFNELWKQLKEKSLVKHDLVQLKNSDVFKYSPYKALSEDQLQVVSELIEWIHEWGNKTYIINGKPGTWKTILAIYLAKSLIDDERTRHLKIWLVVPMTSLRSTISRVFSKIKWLKSSMVIWPSDVAKDLWKPYDILIVDESHRLKQRRNITNYKSFDDVNSKLWFDNSSTELDWILKCSKQQILLYDKNQSIRPSDVHMSYFKSLNAISYELKSQMRIEWGDEYMKFIERLFDLQHPWESNFKQYDFRLYESLEKMVSDIKEKENEIWLSRLVAWYAWPWASRDNSNYNDIQIWSVWLKWNSVTQDWVNSPNAINEVWCIHTVQWYDLNYVWVIIWPELTYNSREWQFWIIKEHYFDKNWWRGIEDSEELKNYIINIYKTLLTRWIKWCYVYCVDEDLRNFLQKYISINK